MASYETGQESGWAPAIMARRKTLMQRLGLGCLAALSMNPVVGWGFIAVWAPAYFLIQAVDLWVFKPMHRDGATRMSPARTVLGCALLFLNAAAFSALSVPLWLSGGPVGMLSATLVVCAGLIYSAVNSPGSRLVLACTMTPQLMYLALLPVLMAGQGASPTELLAISLCLGVFALFGVSVWSVLNRARAAESEARLQSDRKRAEAEAAMAAKSAFVATVGHDLRTPLSAILTGASELHGKAADPAARANAALIAEAGRMMKHLLDDLLDHAKLEAGRMSVEPSVFNLRDLLAHVARFWGGQAQAKGLRLRVEGAASIPAWVEGDPVRVQQILNNLLSNAVKFTAEGSVSLRLKGWSPEPGAAELLIEVSDTGRGMEPAQLKRLFQPFDQTEAGVGLRHGGTGLGLWISRELARLMGGRLTARSCKGCGATFTLALSLPLAEAPIVAPALPILDAPVLAARAAAAEAPAPASEPAPAPEPEPLPVAAEAPAGEDQGERPLRILVVDDHDINRRAVQLILAPLGADISQAADGLAALAAAGAEAFDVIFMDVRMPELDGRETTRRLRAAAGPNQHTPVIAVTADNAPEDVAACRDAGMTWFVAKPLTPATLLGALEAVLMGQASLQDEAAAA